MSLAKNGNMDFAENIAGLNHLYNKEAFVSFYGHFIYCLSV